MFVVCCGTQSFTSTGQTEPSTLEVLEVLLTSSAGSCNERSKASTESAATVAGSAAVGASGVARAAGVRVPFLACLAASFSTCLSGKA